MGIYAVKKCKNNGKFVEEKKRSVTMNPRERERQNVRPVKEIGVREIGRAGF